MLAACSDIAAGDVLDQLRHDRKDEADPDHVDDERDEDDRQGSGAELHDSDRIVDERPGGFLHCKATSRHTSLTM